MHSINLHSTPQRCPACDWIEGTSLTGHMRRIDYCCRSTSANRWDLSTPFLQPPYVRMANKLLGMRSREDDGMNSRVVVGPVHQLVQLVGDVEAKQAVGTAVDPYDQHRSAILDIEVAFEIIDLLVRQFHFANIFLICHDRNPFFIMCIYTIRTKKLF